MLGAVLAQASSGVPAADEPLRGRVEAQWGEYRESTAKVWVDYSEAGDSYSEVDFEKGRFDVEVLVPMESAFRGRRAPERLDELDDRTSSRIKALAEPKAAAQCARMLSRIEPGKAPVLKDQIIDPDDRFFVEAKNAGRYTHDHLVPAMRIGDRPVAGKDGVQRIRVKAHYYLVSDHVMVRARRYAEEVTGCARKYGLDPALIFAVIHTESSFNPLARSKCGALGLMQLVPGQAAREAYEFVYGKTARITADYLFDPRNNIRLGAAYLHMLQSRHFGRLKNPATRRSLTIAAYNCGPGKLYRAILSKHDVDKLSSRQVAALIRRLAPRETRYYVPRVEERMDLYRRL